MCATAVQIKGMQILAATDLTHLKQKNPFVLVLLLHLSLAPI